MQWSATDQARLKLCTKLEELPSKNEKRVDRVDLGPVRVFRIQDIRSGDCDLVVDAGDCYGVGVVLAG